MRQWRPGHGHVAGAADLMPVHGTQGTGSGGLSSPPTLPSSICTISPPSSQLPLLPCQCYHSSSDHINYIPLPPSRLGSEFSSPQTLSNFLPCLRLVTRVTGGLTSPSVTGVWGGVDCLGSSSCYNEAWGLPGKCGQHCPLLRPTAGS